LWVRTEKSAGPKLGVTSAGDAIPLFGSPRWWAGLELGSRRLLGGCGASGNMACGWPLQWKENGFWCQVQFLGSCPGQPAAPSTATLVKSLHRCSHLHKGAGDEAATEQLPVKPWKVRFGGPLPPTNQLGAGSVCSALSPSGNVGICRMWSQT
jgi:hypothetical protein